MKYLDKVLAVATKVKTPLSITGLTVIILYLITKQILSLNIFDKVGAEKTYLVVTDILNKIFWFALIALVLGIICYILSVVYKKRLNRKKSNVKIVDARVDSTMSHYTQTENEQKIKTVKASKRNDNNK